MSSDFEDEGSFKVRKPRGPKKKPSVVRVISTPVRSSTSKSKGRIRNQANIIRKKTGGIIGGIRVIISDNSETPPKKTSRGKNPKQLGIRTRNSSRTTGKGSRSYFSGRSVSGKRVPGIIIISSSRYYCTRCKKIYLADLIVWIDGKAHCPKGHRVKKKK